MWFYVWVLYPLINSCVQVRAWLDLDFSMHYNFCLWVYIFERLRFGILFRFNNAIWLAVFFNFIKSSGCFNCLPMRFFWGNDGITKTRLPIYILRTFGIFCKAVLKYSIGKCWTVCWRNQHYSKELPAFFNYCAKYSFPPLSWQNTTIL